MLRAPLAALAAALALAACGGTAGRTAIGNTGGQPTLADAVRAEVGQGAPVAILPGAGGLLAVSADGARGRTLVPGPVPWALVDHDLGVVWFGSADHTAILALDLRAPATVAPNAEVIVTGLPAEVSPGGPEYAISHESSTDEPGLAGFADLEYSRSILPSVILVVGAEPRLTISGGILEIWGDTEGFAAEVAAAAMPGRDRVRELARRSTGARLPEQPREAGQVADVDPDACEDGSCGRAQEVPGTKLWRVVVSFACGDGCYTGWRLYDPATRAFLDGDWSEWPAQAAIASDGSGFVVDGRLVRFDRGVVAGPEGEPEASGGGWLEPGPWLPL